VGTQDLYVEFLTNVHRDELRLMARNQGVLGFSRMDKPELIIRLLALKIEKAEGAIVAQARLWHQRLASDEALHQAIAELESLDDALKEHVSRVHGRREDDAP